MKTAVFRNAQQLAVEHQNSFDAPDKGDLEAIRPGTFIKVCAEGKGKAERFWVMVTKVEPTPTGPRYTGEVNNDLLRTEFHGLACGDIVEVDFRHVYAVMT